MTPSPSVPDLVSVPKTVATVTHQSTEPTTTPPAAIAVMTRFESGPKKIPRPRPSVAAARQYLRTARGRADAVPVRCYRRVDVGQRPQPRLGQVHADLRDRAALPVADVSADDPGDDHREEFVAGVAPATGQPGLNAMLRTDAAEMPCLWAMSSTGVPTR